MRENDFARLLPECCRIGFASIDRYDAEERRMIEAFLPETQTVIVVAHHIMHSLEWTWFAFDAEPLGEICPADLHTRSMARRVCRRLDRAGHRSVLLPYPGQCGLMFKTLAVRTGLGQLGDSFLFMNVDWGPWIHLRVVLTDVPIAHKVVTAPEVCTHCGQCRTACPSGAIMERDFDGLRCRDGMRGIRNALGQVPYIFECECCLRACPIGPKPRQVVVSYGYQKCRPALSVGN